MDSQNNGTKRPGLRAFTILAASSLTVMAGAAIAPALSEIAVHFKSIPNSEFLVKMILTAPALLIAITAPFMGGFCDRVGRRPVLTAGVIVYGVAGCSALVLTNLYAILVGRAFMGIAVAAVLTSCTTLIGDFYEGHERNRFMGLQAAFMSYSGVLFPLASGALVSISWQHPFGVYAVAFLVLPGIWLSLKEPEHRPHSHASESDDNPFPIWTLAMLFALSALYMICYFTIPAQFSFYLERKFDATGLQTGMTLSFVSFSIGSCAMMFHRIRKFISAPSIVIISLFCMAVGFQILYRTNEWMGIGFGVFIAGVGLGILGPNLTTWSLSFTPERLRGRVTGGIAASFFLGQFLSPIIAEPMVRAWGITGTFHAVSIFLFCLGLLFVTVRYTLIKKT